jgi:hypothetical protein
VFHSSAPVFPRGNTLAHIDGDNPVSLIGAANFHRRHPARSTTGAFVVHDGSPGPRPYSVGYREQTIALELTASEACAVALALR